MIVNCLTDNQLYFCTRPDFMKWKTRKEEHDRRVCEHKIKKGNVFGSLEAALLASVFDKEVSSRKFGGTPYECKICKKWHFAKAQE